MAPKPEPPGLASVFRALSSVFGIVLAVAAILAIMAWADRHWAAPSSPTEAVYQPQHLNLF
jgi:hypothetical protein